MRQKLIIILAVVLILALGVPALAATVSSQLTPEQSKEISAIYKQIADLKKQLVDKYVEYGRLTPEQGQQVKERIEARQEYFEKNPGAFGPGYCPRFNNSGGRWQGTGTWSCPGLFGGGMMGRYWNSNPLSPTGN